MSSRSPQEIADAIEDARDEIAMLIAQGEVPADVTSWEDLHDHVDANEIAGFCDERADWSPEDFSTVQTVVNVWLANGRPAVGGF